MKLTSQKDRYNKLAKRLNKYILRIDNIFNSLSMEVSKIVVSTKHQSGEFSFSDYPETKDKINQLQSNFASSILGTVHSGISEEWKNSNLAQDLIADEVLAKTQSKIKGKRYNRYYQTNNDALKAFLNRKDNGMNLSTKIWNLSADYKNELEHAISTSVEKGISAITLSKRIAKYLNDFPSLKKDFKEKFGKAATCYDCEYRTMRLARTEINMAYRTAEGERWRQFDFVIGIEIKLSKNHNCKGVPHGQFYDICDTLAEKYPKDFKFVGWHPNCRCYQIPILAKDDELDELLEVGDKNNNQPVTELPNQFQQWLKDNQKRIENAKSLPYFIRDNQSLINKKHHIRVSEEEVIADSLYTGGNPFEAGELAKLKDYETRIIDGIMSGRRVDNDLIEEYHDYVLQLSEKYYPKQVSLFTDEERNAMKAIADKYLARPKTNPHRIWDNHLGGVYSGNDSKVNVYLPKLAGLTREELSIVQRFTNDTTFSNCYNLRNESEYWRNKFKNKLSRLSRAEIKEQYEIIEEWSQGANYTLDRMVRYNGITFRGLDSGGGPELRETLLQAFKKNKPWVNNASCSTSMKHRVAESFDGDTILIIHNKTGAYIHAISDYSSEYEIMTLRGTKYKVLDPPKRIGSRYYVELEEII